MGSDNHYLIIGTSLRRTTVQEIRGANTQAGPAYVPTVRSGCRQTAHPTFEKEVTRERARGNRCGGREDPYGLASAPGIRLVLHFRNVATTCPSRGIHAARPRRMNPAARATTVARMDIAIVVLLVKHGTSRRLPIAKAFLGVPLPPSGCIVSTGGLERSEGRRPVRGRNGISSPRRSPRCRRCCSGSPRGCASGRASGP